MPEILLRMQIVNNHSLLEMQDMFNLIMNRISKKQGPLDSGTAALYHFPEVF